MGQNQQNGRGKIESEEKSRTPQFENLNTKDIITPIRVDILEKLLKESKYDEAETGYLVDGFKNGFDIK